MTTLPISSKQAAACGALGLRASRRPCLHAPVESIDSGIGIGLVVVDAANGPFAPAF
jgi:hypothetical protein